MNPAPHSIKSSRHPYRDSCSGNNSQSQERTPVTFASPSHTPDAADPRTNLTCSCGLWRGCGRAPGRCDLSHQHAVRGFPDSGFRRVQAFHKSFDRGSPFVRLGFSPASTCPFASNTMSHVSTRRRSPGFVLRTRTSWLETSALEIRTGNPVSRNALQPQVFPPRPVSALCMLSPHACMSLSQNSSGVFARGACVARGEVSRLCLQPDAQQESPARPLHANWVGTSISYVGQVRAPKPRVS